MPKKSAEPVVVASEEAPKPQVQFRRKADGLLEGVEYIYDTDGTINWKAMIKKDFLVPNKEKFPPTTDFTALDINLLEDNQLLILLGGVKNLALLRGFTCVNYDVLAAREDYVAVKCTINWIGNFETDNIPVEFSALADAHLQNTSGFGNKFLMAIAENRAFVRAVRNFLRINIAGQDEIDPSNKGNKTDVAEESQPTNPATLLCKTMSSAGLTFDVIKSKLIEEGTAEAEAWTSVNDIPRRKILEIIERIRRKSAKQGG